MITQIFLLVDHLRIQKNYFENTITFYCRRLCVYCYAKTSKDTVLKNKDKHNDESESIIG